MTGRLVPALASNPDPFPPPTRAVLISGRASSALDTCADLEEIGDLEGYISRSVRILVVRCGRVDPVLASARHCRLVLSTQPIHGHLSSRDSRPSLLGRQYCSSGYFTSKNCIRELVATTNQNKPVIALIDLDATRGGLSLEEVRKQLLETDGMYVKWGFMPNDDDAPKSGADRGLIWPGGEALHDHIFLAAEPIEWNRIGHFQAVTMRLIAEQLLPAELAGQTCIDRELISQVMKPLKAPEDGHRYHLYCSKAHNPGCVEAVQELAIAQGYDFVLDGADEDGLQAADPSRIERVELKKRSSTSRLMAQTDLSQAPRVELHVTTDATKLQQCDHMMLFLTGQTYTRGDDASDALAKELTRAMDLNVHVLLVHEMPGVGGQEARHGCEFGTFFAHPKGATPSELLKRGIYSEIAVPLKGGPWRETSMVLFAMAIGLGHQEVPEGAPALDWLESSIDTMRLRRGMSKSNMLQRELFRKRLSNFSRLALTRSASPEVIVSRDARRVSVSYTTPQCIGSVSASSASPPIDERQVDDLAI